MSGRTAPGSSYIVAYEATDRGAEAVALGTALARLTGAVLRICLVIPPAGPDPAKASSAVSGLAAPVREQAEEWLRQAAGLVPADVTATTHLLIGESTSEALIDAVGRFGADRIVVGASRNGVFRRFTIGSVANALLHASPVPVALAPASYRAPQAIGRITCAVGTRPGWETLLDAMAVLSRGLSVDLRFVTLIEIDAARGRTVSASTATSRAHLRIVLDYFTRRSEATGAITTEVAAGPSLEAAVEALNWRENEIVLVGSSRLAQHARIFLGATANRMLRSLPVPLIVVPIDARRL